MQESLLECSAREGDSPVTLHAPSQQRYRYSRVGLFGTAALIARYTSRKAKYRHETDSEQVE